MGTLQLQNVSKRLGNHQAVDKVSLEVKEGEFFVLLGPSGGGKSTLLRLICGLETPDEGRVILNGQDITDLPPRRRNLGMVFQDYGLYPNMDVFGNIAYGLQARNMAKHEIDKRVPEAAEKLGLAEHLRRGIQDLSGGEQQRVALARAMVKDADCYLYDEPLSNLDPKLRFKARHDIMKVHRLKQQPSVYVTHEQSEAFSMGDRIAVIGGGALQQVGPADELLNHPVNLFMARFIGSPSMNLLRGRLERGSPNRLVGDGFGLELSLSCYGPTRIFLGGNLLYKSDVSEDVNLENRKVIPARLEAGWNDFVITLRKTASGFGCRFGSNLPKWAPLSVLSPFAERAGGAGWTFSEVVDRDRYRDERPDLTGSEAETGLRWFPELDWPEGDRRKLPCARLFGPQPGRYAYAWTNLVSPMPGLSGCVLEGLAAGPTRAWLDGEEILTTGPGPFRAEVGLEHGAHTLLVETVSGEDDWGVALKGTVAGVPCTFEPPVPVHGVDDPWLYLGPFSARQDPAGLTTLYRLFDDGDNEGEGRYWRVDRPEMWVRPFLENSLFAKWNYPLGVTLYGLLQAGRVLGRGDLVSYVTAHISECTRLHPYALWDRARYGFPGINQQLAQLDMLDDCGSFGSAMLEAYPEAGDPGYRAVAELIAKHMAEGQERREDGAFYRRLEGDFMENTLWADDLYMSTPFMLRYARLSGQRAFLDDAARQFLRFEKYLFIPEHRVLSHVYDFKYETATLVPWGRGNGWALFSLSELLEVLPEEHPDRAALLAFFRELSEGYRALQGEHGLWHQVLTDPASYEETSCTAMFAYGFARGVRFGWFEDPGPYANAVQRAWRGLTARAVDRQGNVHGVCRGSRYSFTPDYYKDELGTVLNDTHGIGIVLLAGIEVQKLRAFLRGATAADPSVIPPVVQP